MGAAIGGSIPYLVYWLTFGWFYPDTHTSTGITVATHAPPPPSVVALQPEPVLKPVVEIPPTIAPPTPSVTRTDCIFLDPDRTQDENGKVRVKCGSDLYQAKATYMGEGRFDFTDLTSGTP
jgi:hypothetical protein